MSSPPSTPDTTGETPTPTPTLAADRADERLIASHGVGGFISTFVDRLRSGELGSLPVVLGLVIIWGVFQALNPAFLSSRNLVNLSLQSAATGTLALGIVLVLLLGQIDLSIGSVSGVSAAAVAVGFVQQGWPLVVAILAAILCGMAIGLFYGWVFTRWGVPSFVITLAGLLGFLGLQVWVLGDAGAINIPFESGLVKFATAWFLPAWLAYALVLGCAAAYVALGLADSRHRSTAGLTPRSRTALLVRAGVLAAIGLIGAYVLNQDRGVSVMFLTFLVLVFLTDLAIRRTRWGRAVLAIGGNVEAARRAGINVRAVYLSVFTACSTFAAVGGLFAAARLASASQSSGGADTNLNAIAAAVIGGTSLFGGRGSAWSAVLGILVIQSISSGLSLLSLDSSVRFMVTGAVLLLAVTVDSLSRRSRAAHGRA